MRRISLCIFLDFFSQLVDSVPKHDADELDTVQKRQNSRYTSRNTTTQIPPPSNPIPTTLTTTWTTYNTPLSSPRNVDRPPRRNDSHVRRNRSEESEHRGRSMRLTRTTRRTESTTVTRRWYCGKSLGPRATPSQRFVVLPLVLSFFLHSDALTIYCANSHHQDLTIAAHHRKSIPLLPSTDRALVLLSRKPLPALPPSSTLPPTPLRTTRLASTASRNSPSSSNPSLAKRPPPPIDPSPSPRPSKRSSLPAFRNRIRKAIARHERNI